MIQPVAAFRIFRHDLLQFSPEHLRMIHLLKMCQFMDNDIFDHLKGQHGQLPVKLQILLSIAATPNGGLILHVDVL